MHNPQNPYRSSVVRASAGSGKTYQLSRRFLNLVGAGASPSSILTVTFTKKAAAEMRARILDLAAKLLASEKERTDFEEQLKEFYHSRENQNSPPPLSALETASRILASTQSLKISTIDSILLEWLKKFPFEASGDGALKIPPRFDLMSPFSEEKYQRRSWARTLKSLKEMDTEAFNKLLDNPEEMHFVAMENRLRELQKHESFLWLLKAQSSHLSPQHVTHPIDEDWSDSGEEGLLEALRPHFRSLLETISKDRQFELGEALSQNSLEGLRSGRFLTGEMKVHGNTFRTAKKNSMHAASVESIDRLALSYTAYLLKHRLNKTGELLMKIFEDYQAETSQLKFEERSLGFSDLIKGGYYLFSHDDAAGARYLLNRSIRHLLLDEFQDTSILQWTVFESMAEEMLSGEAYRSTDELDPTLFIVGDAKQSIYGFREADAEILTTAANFMIQRKASDIELSKSYRTHPLLLNFVNAAMGKIIEDFPTHIPAEVKGENLIQGRASITLSRLFRPSDPGGSGKPILDEAEFIAEFVATKISRQDKVYDKSLKGYRPMRASDCALLYRNSTHARSYAEALRGKGLSVRIEEGQSFFARPEIMDLMALCRLMAFPSDLQAAVQILKSPLIAAPEAQILKQLKALKIAQSTEEKSPDQVGPLLAGLADYSEKFFKFYTNRHLDKPSLGLEKFLSETKVLGKYLGAFGPEDGPLATANIQKFLELVLDSDRSSELSWMEVLQSLETREKEQSVSLPSISDDAIHLMTIHKAKGLEWPLVVLAGTGEEWERPDLYWAKLKDSHLGTGLSYIGKRADLPLADPHFKALTKSLQEESLRENHRLLYVALTRAQFELLVTGYQKKDKDDSYFHGLLRKTAEELGFGQAESDEGLMVFAEDELPDAQVRSKALGHTINLSSFKTKTNLNSEGVKILAPARLLADKEPNLSSGLALPYPAEAGTYIHRALELSMREESFEAEAYWQSLRRHHSAKEFEMAFRRVDEEREKILRSGAWLDLTSNKKAFETELPIAYLHNSQLVRGVIDLLVQREENRWLIVDYKTSWEALAGGDLKALCYEKRYDQQLALYKEGVRRLYPESIIECAIFFTAQEALVLLDI